MEFGKLSNIENVNWELPPDIDLSLSYLKKTSSPVKSTLYYLGTPAWGHKEWVGLIYPPKTKTADYLYHYSRHYQCIELNTSHYRIPSPEQTQKWVNQVSPEFLFCPKVYQEISHRQNGLLNHQMIQLWYDFLQNLGPHCGPSFLQLPPHFDYSYKAVLFQFLKQWPSEFELSIEFRHPSWFQNNQILPALTQYLQTRNIGLVITDVAGRRDVVHTSISSQYVLIRFIGNDLHPSDSTRMQSWAERFKKWSDQGLQKVFFFVHEPDDIRAPEMTQITIQKLTDVCEANLQPLQFQSLERFSF